MRIFFKFMRPTDSTRGVRLLAVATSAASCARIVSSCLQASRRASKLERCCGRRVSRRMPFLPSSDRSALRATTARRAACEATSACLGPHSCLQKTSAHARQEYGTDVRARRLVRALLGEPRYAQCTDGTHLPAALSTRGHAERRPVNVGTLSSRCSARIRC